MSIPNSTEGFATVIPPHAALSGIPKKDASHPMEAQSYNGRGVMNLTPLKRLRLAAEEGEKRRKDLRAAAINKICQAVLSDEAMQILKTEGHLSVDIRFKNGSPLKDACFKRLAVSLDDLEIPSEVASSIEPNIKERINPAIIRFAFRSIGNYSFLDSIHLEVSDCRHYLLMNQNGIITGSTPISSYQIHDENAVHEEQARLAKAEKEYQNTPADAHVVEKLFQNIFDVTNPASPLKKTLDAIKARKLTGKVSFKIAFNCSDSDFDKLNVPKEGREFITYATARLDETAALIQKVKDETDLEADPSCKFVRFDSKKNQVIFSFENSGVRSDYVKMIAEWVIL